VRVMLAEVSRFPEDFSAVVVFAGNVFEPCIH
jgi:hypothetical protein